MSMVVSAPRCTPPMPPVANTRMPASEAMIMVEATVVAPVRPSAHITGKSRRDTLATFSPLHISSSSLCERPTFSTPPIIAMVAGTAPSARMIFSISAAKARFSG